jgi:hypothetical protein
MSRTWGMIQTQDAQAENAGSLADELAIVRSRSAASPLTLLQVPKRSLDECEDSTDFATSPYAYVCISPSRTKGGGSFYSGAREAGETENADLVTETVRDLSRG